MSLFLDRYLTRRNLVRGAHKPESLGASVEQRMNRLIQDAKYALRMMRRAPIFTAAIVLTIALAIAANTTIFSLVYAVLLKPLPYAEPDRIVQVFEKNDKFNIANIGASGINFFLWRDEMQGVQNVAGAGFGVYTLAGSGDPSGSPGI